MMVPTYGAGRMDRIVLSAFREERQKAWKSRRSGKSCLTNAIAVGSQILRQGMA